MYIVLFLLTLLALPFLLSYAGIRMSRSAEQWSEEVKDIAENDEFSESVDFFYSKWLVLFDVLMFATLTGSLLVLNTAFLWAPRKHANDFLAGILLGAIFLPFTIFFGLKAKNAIAQLINVGRPAIALFRSGYQYEDRFFPWTSIESITTTSYRTAFLIVKHKTLASETKETVAVNLSLLTKRHLPEYMEKYRSTFGDPSVLEGATTPNPSINTDAAR